MTSALVASPVLGVQSPRVLWTPPTAVSSTGGEAIELARMAGLDGDQWQQFVAHHALGERADGKWAAWEIVLEVARQNGKGGILEIRELVGLFLLGERLITHTAHLFDTSLEAFRRLLELIESTPDFDRRVRKVSRAHGEEGIELKGGQRIRFRTRTKGGGRGFTGDLLILDEAMFLSAAMLGALLPTLSARPNPQVWYVGSAVDQNVHDHGEVFARVRERGRRGGDPALAYFGFSAPFDHPDDVTPEAAADPRNWALANPALGIRISAEHIERERRSMDPRTFAVERLGVGDWPSTDEEQDKLLEQAWAAGVDELSEAQDPVCFAIDVTPDRGAASIGVAGRRADKRPHVELVERRRGTAWVAPRLVELTGRHRTTAIALDANGPAASLLPDLTAHKLKVTSLNSKEVAQACGAFYDAVVPPPLVDDEEPPDTSRMLRHLGTPELTAAVRGAVTRPLGDAWAWSRKSSTVDISPLVAVTLALRALETQKPRRSRVVNLNDALRRAQTEREVPDG